MELIKNNVSMFYKHFIMFRFKIECKFNLHTVVCFDFSAAPLMSLYLRNSLHYHFYVDFTARESLQGLTGTPEDERFCCSSAMSRSVSHMNQFWSESDAGFRLI